MMAEPKPDDVDVPDLEPAILVSLRAVAADVLGDRTPVSLLPALLRSHIRLTSTRCTCGHDGDWVAHLTQVMTAAGMIARFF